jgi:hypothetical protein
MKKRLTIEELYGEFQKEAERLYAQKMPECLKGLFVKKVEEWRKSFYK